MAKLLRSFDRLLHTDAFVDGGEGWCVYGARYGQAELALENLDGVFR